MTINPDFFCVVAIPVKDEEERIAQCLEALAGQGSHVLLLVNDTSDSTIGVARGAADRLGLSLSIEERAFRRGLGSAGHARHVAMEMAASWAKPGGVLFSTDADTRVAPDWVRANLAHIRAGCDAVAGRAVLDPADAASIPRRLHEDDALECGYGALLDEIGALLDPVAADPWPRHAEHSGASICVTVAAYRRAGGMPDRALGEDRAFFAALGRVDAAVRHAPEVTVAVSGRCVGRAAGGMADTIRRRLHTPDVFLDDALEPVVDAARRARARGRLRRLWLEPAANGLLARRLATDLQITAAQLRDGLRAGHFGEAWARLEAGAPALRYRRVPVADVLTQTVEAQALVASLRQRRAALAAPMDGPATAGEDRGTAA